MANLQAIRDLSRDFECGFYSEETYLKRLEELTGQRSIKTEKRTVYGKVLIYPTCELGQRFASLLGVKTLTEEQIKNINIVLNWTK